MDLNQLAERDLARCGGCTMKEGEVRARRLLREVLSFSPSGEHRVRWVTTGRAAHTVLRATPVGLDLTHTVEVCGKYPNVESEQVVIRVDRSSSPEWVEWRNRRYLDDGDKDSYERSLNQVLHVMGDFARITCHIGSDGQACYCKNRRTGVIKQRSCVGCGRIANRILNCRCGCLSGEDPVDGSKLGGFTTRELIERPDGADREGRARYLWVIEKTNFDTKSKQHKATGIVIPVLVATVIGSPQSGDLVIGGVAFTIEWETVSVRRVESAGPFWVENRVRSIKPGTGKITGGGGVPVDPIDNTDRTGEECYVERSNGGKDKGSLVCVKNPESGVYSCTCITATPNQAPPGGGGGKGGGCV